MELVKKVQNFSPAGNRRIGSLLADLGLSYSTANFWSNNHSRLDEILYDVRHAHKRLLIAVSPRTTNDDDESARRLNQIFQEIERRFDEHQNPKPFYRPTPKNHRRFVERNWKPKPRRCQRCHRTFQPNAVNKFNCAGCKERKSTLGASIKFRCVVCGVEYEPIRSDQMTCASDPCQNNMTALRGRRYRQRKKQ